LFKRESLPFLFGGRKKTHPISIGPSAVRYQQIHFFSETPRRIRLATGSPALYAGMNFQSEVDLMSPWSAD
jgi:hypothetical protein